MSEISFGVGQRKREWTHLKSCRCCMLELQDLKGVIFRNMTHVCGQHEIRPRCGILLCSLPPGGNENRALWSCMWSLILSLWGSERLVFTQHCSFVRELAHINSWGHIWFHKCVAMAQKTDPPRACRGKDTWDLEHALVKLVHGFSSV